MLSLFGEFFAPASSRVRLEAIKNLPYFDSVSSWEYNSIPKDAQSYMIDLDVVEKIADELGV